MGQSVPSVQARGLAGKGGHPVHLKPEATFEGTHLCLEAGGPGPPGTIRSGCVLPASFRSASGCDVEDGASFLLSASPDWWLGEWGCATWAATCPDQGQASRSQAVWTRGWAGGRD